MENIYRYKLASNKVKKIDCIHCGKERHWQLYIDTFTGEVLPNRFGKCDNENKCGIWIKPKSRIEQERLIIKYDNKIVFFFDYDKELKDKIKAFGARYDKANNNWYLINESLSDNLKTFAKQYDFKIVEHKKKETVYIPDKVLLNTLKGYEHNAFLQNLAFNVPYPFIKSDLEKVVSLYRLGTHKKALTIPYINEHNKVCAIQVKEFDKENHTTNTTFLHSILEQEIKPVPQWISKYNEQDLKVSCLFGAHLLEKYPYNKIALVEAPKTATIANLYFGFPDNIENFLWMAVYNLSSLTYEKCKVLKNREVFLFPDLSIDGKAFKLWSDKAKELESRITGSRFIVSDLLEKFADKEARQNGFDLADYLIKQDWRLFRKQDKSKAKTVNRIAENRLKSSCENEKEKAYSLYYVSDKEREILLKKQKGHLHNKLNFNKQTLEPCK